MTGGRAWRLLGYFAVFNFSSADVEVEAGSICQLSVCCGVPWRGPRVQTKCLTCPPRPSLSLTPRKGLFLPDDAFHRLLVLTLR